MLAALAATSMLCACGPRTESTCMSPGEIGTIREVAKYDQSGLHGSAEPKAIVRFQMRRYLPRRGAIRLCTTSDDEAFGLLHIGDTLRPNGMYDVTP